MTNSPKQAIPTIQSRIRRGKLRKHKEGYSIHIFRGDDTLLATVYGGDQSEAEVRALIVIEAFEDEVSIRLRERKDRTSK